MAMEKLVLRVEKSNSVLCYLVPLLVFIQDVTRGVIEHFVRVGLFKTR